MSTATIVHIVFHRFMPLLFSLFILLAEFAALALVQFATEALLYQIVQTVAQRLQFHVVDDLVDEGVLQQQAGFLEGDASLLHVEQGGIVQLTNG
jgi:ABC-type transport system involved in cytochrome bd biosynthesis fused ATPase/permease subunit